MFNPFSMSPRSPCQAVSTLLFSCVAAVITIAVVVLG
jgi:hypothetical protein